MSTVLLLSLLIISIIMTGLILIQRSEGGALGIGGGGGGGGGFMSGRSAANSVSRMTGILGAVFLVVSLALSIVMNKENSDNFLLDGEQAEQGLTNPADSAEETIPLDGVDDTAVTGEESPTEVTPETDTETPETSETPERE